MHREMDSQNSNGLLGDTFRYSAHCIIVTVTVPELLMVLHRDRGRITKQSSVCVTHKIFCWGCFEPGPRKQLPLCPLSPQLRHCWWGHGLDRLAGACADRWRRTMTTTTARSFFVGEIKVWARRATWRQCHALHGVRQLFHFSHTSLDTDQLRRCETRVLASTPSGTAACGRDNWSWTHCFENLVRPYLVQMAAQEQREVNKIQLGA